MTPSSHRPHQAHQQTYSSIYKYPETSHFLSPLTHVPGFHCHCCCISNLTSALWPPPGYSKQTTYNNNLFKGRVCHFFFFCSNYCLLTSSKGPVGSAPCSPPNSICAVGPLLHSGHTNPLILPQTHQAHSTPKALMMLCSVNQESTVHGHLNSRLSYFLQISNLNVSWAALPGHPEVDRVLLHFPGLGCAPPAQATCHCWWPLPDTARAPEVQGPSFFLTCFVNLQVRTVPAILKRFSKSLFNE